MSSQDTFNVAVTGNRPFLEYPVNTSQLVRDALPDAIDRPNKPIIRILKYDRDTLDTYADVRRVSREIWGGSSSLFRKPVHTDGSSSQGNDHVDIDLILHLGMVAFDYPQTFTFETIAHRDGYELPGDDGKPVDSEELKQLGLPETLATAFDVEAAWRKVKAQFPDTPTSVSKDAGHYFCEFRLYSSLAEPLLGEALSKKRGRTVFQHLPERHLAEDIALATRITMAYITALADDPIANGDGDFNH
ncbi:hypothetical protein PEX1_074730 [Penicillium expansum]|uniref:Peptidase C15, pyroglutamyl peptidase I n=1 Tax=Penicillium expansum TaxID=27334 RepID=A0A0A2L137_PENEN|nr:hypothetical protein PEX2_103070 [Penicillium expansum]KGO37975.1 hypothetical protein PEXP_079910 [Penicillium expansum]KGO49674.1 hypothetical protein PEX2_103070 [Penicillium expansum]KGO72871.1 hypothetical protein PEX1_074730 [Penicillium expansum]